MKFFVLIFLLLNAFNLMGITPQKQNIWHDKKASYKLTLTLPKVSKSNFAAFQHSKILIPVAFDTGVKVFNSANKELPIYYDASKRNILIPGTDKEEEIYLYLGYIPQDSFIVPTIDKTTTKAHQLTLEEVSWWRAIPNFHTYLNDQITRIKKSHKANYDNFQKITNIYKNGIFFLPPSQKIQMKNYPWEISGRALANKNYSYRKNLYNSRLLNGEWRVLQSDNLRALFRDAHFYKYRFIHEANSISQKPKYYNKNWQKHLNSNRDKVVFGHIQDNFDKRTKQEAHYPEQISLITREWDLNGIPVLCFQGNFYTEKEITYELKVITNSLWFLELNGEIVAKHEFNNKISPNMDLIHTNIQKFPLKPGLTPFKFYYFRNSSTMDLDVKIRKPNGTFKEFTEHILTAGVPVKIKKIENITKAQYPIILRERLHTIMTGKQSYLYLENLSFPPNTKFFYKNKQIFLPPNTPTVLTTSWNKDFSFSYQEKLYNLPAVIQAGKPAISKGIIDFNLETYPIKYLDEAVNFNVKIENSLTTPLPLQFNVKIFDINQKLLFQETQELTSPIGNHLLNYQIPQTNISDLPPNFTVETEIFILGFSFGKKYLTYLSSQNINSKITISNNKFISKKDKTPIILNLKRMKLSDLRNWQLPKLLSFFRNDKTLILGTIDDTNLLKSLTLNPKYTILNFDPFGIQLQSGLLNTLTSINEKLIKEKYTNIIVYPPLADIPYLGEELFFKYLSLIYEMANNSSYTKSVQLIIPLNISLEHENILLKQAREYGLKVITKETRKKICK